jgi:hypothetical protein
MFILDAKYSYRRLGKGLGIVAVFCDTLEASSARHYQIWRHNVYTLNKTLCGEASQYAQ